MKREFRMLCHAELRAKAGDKPGIEGYAAVFNQRSEQLGGMMGGFREIVLPGAFSRAIREKQDVCALVNHVPSQILGRTKSGTLTLREDGHGLFFSVDLPDTQVARDLTELVRRGDIDGCSFGFMAIKQKWGEEPDPGNSKRTVSIRELHDVDLFDVSAVTYPAYPATSLDARSLWPDGIPDEIRIHVSELREAKTKRVGGKDLTASAFAYVGDPEDTSTWKLRIDDEGHARNALARFNQTQGIPANEKDKVWNKIVAAAKKFGIHVSEENALKRQMVETEPDGDEPDGDLCECECAECQAGDHENCSNQECADANCNHAARSLRILPADAPPLDKTVRDRMQAQLELAAK
jgi:HK97 family phage prohead protease